MAVAPLLQVRRMLARRSSADVSVGYLAILLPGFALWVEYGRASGDLALVAPNVVAFLVGAATIMVAVRLCACGAQTRLASMTASVQLARGRQQPECQPSGIVPRSTGRFSRLHRLEPICSSHHVCTDIPLTSGSATKSAMMRKPYDIGI